MKTNQLTGHALNWAVDTTYLRRSIMKIEIDTDELIAEAVNHMENMGDVRWSIGMALQMLYWNKGWEKVQTDLTNRYIEKKYNQKERQHD